MLRLAFIALCVIGSLAADDEACTLRHEGKYYDLNQLKASKDYEFKTPGDHLFAINVCKRPVSETFGLKDVDDSEVGGFIRRDHGDFSIGTLNTTLSVQDSRLHITLSNGSVCKSKSGDNHVRASTSIEFVCDTSVYDSGTPRLVAQLPPGDDEDGCAFFIEWRTHVACPTNEPGGVWGFFTFLIMTLISLALLYLVTGTLYNRYILQLRGFDQIPQFSIESMKYHACEAFDWIKDLIGGMRHGGAYSRMTNNNRSAPLSDGFPRGTPSSGGVNPVSHQSQVPSAIGEGGEGFVRPQHTRTGSAMGRKTDINPISHQAQTPAQVMPNQPELRSSPPQVPPVKKSKPRPKPFDLESTVQEREFMLGGDEEDEGEEMGAIMPSVTLPQAQTTAQPAETTEGNNANNVDSAARLRGRDAGSKGTILL